MPSSYAPFYRDPGLDDQPKTVGRPASPPPLPPEWENLARTTTDINQWFALKRLYQMQPGRYDGDRFHRALYSNPMAAQFDTASGGDTGLWGRVKNAAHSTFGRDTRIGIAKTAAAAAGISLAAGAAAGGAGAGAGAGSGLTASEMAAAGVDPFLVGGGVGAGGAAAAGAGAAGAAGAGGLSWKQMVLHGIPVVQGYLDARQAAKQAQNLQEAAERQRRETLGFASPDAYLENYGRYREAFKESYRPWLVGEQDRAAIGEQGALQAFDTDVARRGLSGSGLALAGRSAIRTGRQAQIAENMRRYWTMTDEAARDAAGQTRSAQISASMGAPNTYVPRPSPATAAVGGLGDAYRDWLWLQSTENNPFVSRKDARY